MNMGKKTYPPMGLEDVFKFGKHKGDRLWQVLRDDYSYIVWAVENIDFELDDEAYSEYINNS